MTAPSPLAVMRFRQYTASEPYDYTIPRSADRAKVGAPEFQYQLKYKRGDEILIPVDNLGFDHPVGINETNGQVGNIANLDHLRLDLDGRKPPTRSYQIHGIIDLDKPTEVSPFRPNDYEHLNKPPGQLSEDASSSRWQYSFGEPLLLRPISNEQLKNQTERLVHLFNLCSGKPLSLPMSSVQLFPNYRYIGTVPVLDPRFSGARAAFTCGQLVTAAMFGKRSIRLGHRDITNSVYCISSTTGAAAWVLQDKLEPIEHISLDAYKESLSWTQSTVASKRRRKRLTDASSSASPEGVLVKQEDPPSDDEYAQSMRRLQIEGTNTLTLTYVDDEEDAPGETDHELFDDDNSNPYYDETPSPSSPHEGEDDPSLAPLRVKQEDLGNGQGLRTRISIDKNRPQTPEHERRLRRDQAMLESWHQRRLGGEERTGRHPLRGRHRRVQQVAVMHGQMGTEGLPVDPTEPPGQQEIAEELLIEYPEDGVTDALSVRSRFSTPVTPSTIDTPVLSAKASPPFGVPDDD
ncbi:hypothetical protein Dda_3345 [Drechslerella dactyloides]|uniref:Uncharacterized protein n=1 Tax=Drechslerella dactyloides TaxID=74499 RepID=A0AAD6J2R2_DREDA|nr:hypothetical protein Dda_3345 [Drechslerella dactyloides]